MSKSKSGRIIKIEDLPERYRAQVSQKLAAEQSSNKVKPNKSTPHNKSSPPHDLLWEHLSYIPGIVREYANAVPGRRFRIDIAHPDLKIAIEVDGWQYHGKYKEAHEKDRERQNLLSVQGWTILRFTTGQIFKNTDECLNIIHKTFIIRALNKEQVS